MLTEQQKAAIQAATLVLGMAGITAWFEARIIKDSDKKLNGKRISSKRRTDLDSVLKVAEAKRVGMLPDMRMELRMYATAASSRSVFMGQEQPPATGQTAAAAELKRIQDAQRWGGMPGAVAGVANYSPSKNVDRLRAEGVAEDSPLMQQAKRKARRYDPGPPDLNAPHTGVVVLPTPATHTCDAKGPMRQRESGGPFLSTCSVCGGFNASK